MPENEKPTVTVEVDHQNGAQQDLEIETDHDDPHLAIETDESELQKKDPLAITTDQDPSEVPSDTPDLALHPAASHSPSSPELLLSSPLPPTVSSGDEDSGHITTTEALQKKLLAGLSNSDNYTDIGLIVRAWVKNLFTILENLQILEKEARAAKASELLSQAADKLSNSSSATNAINSTSPQSQLLPTELDLDLHDVLPQAAHAQVAHNMRDLATQLQGGEKKSSSLNPKPPGPITFSNEAHIALHPPAVAALPPQDDAAIANQEADPAVPVSPQSPKPSIT